ncbi:phage protein [Pseudomonas phage PA02]|nr:phage protein [Pseudomonas phage PA02]
MSNPLVIKSASDLVEPKGTDYKAPIFKTSYEYSAIRENSRKQIEEQMKRSKQPFIVLERDGDIGSNVVYYTCGCNKEDSLFPELVITACITKESAINTIYAIFEKLKEVKQITGGVEIADLLSAFEEDQRMGRQPKFGIRPIDAHQFVYGFGGKLHAYYNMDDYYNQLPIWQILISDIEGFLPTDSGYLQTVCPQFLLADKPFGQAGNIYPTDIFKTMTCRPSTAIIH